MTADDERKKLLAGQDWERARAALVKVAFDRTKNKAWAEDLAQEAITRAFDTKHNPWDSARHPKIEHFLGGIVLRLISNEWSSARAHRELQIDAFEGEGDTAPSPEEAAARRDLLDQRCALLRVRLAKNERAVTLLDLIENEVETAEEQKQATGWEMKDVRNARKRLFVAAERVAADIPLDGYEAADQEPSGTRASEDDEVLQ